MSSPSSIGIQTVAPQTGVSAHDNPPQQATAREADSHPAKQASPQPGTGTHVDKKA